MSNLYRPGCASTTFVPDTLVVDDMDIVTDSGILASGQTLTRGALLGKITASGKYILSLAAAVDGSQLPSAILVDDVDASGGDASCGLYLAGGFNAAAITFGTGHTRASVADGLRGLSIYLRDTIPGV